MRYEVFSTLTRRFLEDGTFRRSALIVLTLVLLYILIIPEFLWNRSAQKNLAAIRKKQTEFASLAGEYQSLGQHTNAIERKRSLTATGGLTQAIGDITLSLGIKEKVKSIKGMGTRKISNQLTEESAELQLEKLNASELIHFLQKIENAPMILSVTRVVIKKSFENPDRLDVTAALSLFK
jgi:hypothetical protein